MLLLFALLVWPAALAADYRDSFKRGVQALDRSNWAEAERLFRQAIAERPQENQRDNVEISGMRFVPYVPHYFLGYMLFKQAKYADALREWEISEKQGAIQTTRQYADLRRDRQVAEQKAPPVPSNTGSDTGGGRPAATEELTKEIQATEALLKKAEGANRALLSSSDFARAKPLDATLAETEFDLRDDLNSARAKLEAGRAARNPDQVKEAQTIAAAVLKKIDDARGRVAKVATATSPAGSGEKPAGEGGASKSGGEKVTPPAGEGKTAPGTTTATGAGSSGTTVLTEPPPGLVTAAQLYFRGRYREAADRLSRLQYSNRQANLQAHLFHAAAAYALFVVDGEDNEALRREAEAHVRACRQFASRGFAPDERLFSPRFREFFDRTQ